MRYDREVKKLATFQVEDDASIVLNFQDGSIQRVAPAQLDDLLRPTDASRVKISLGLRQKYQAYTRPPWALMFSAATMVLLIALAGTKVAGQYMWRSVPATTPPAQATMIEPAPHIPKTLEQEISDLAAQAKAMFDSQQSPQGGGGDKKFNVRSESEELDKDLHKTHDAKYNGNDDGKDKDKDKERHDES